MRFAPRVKRSLVLGAAGAMVLSLLPAGMAAADVIATDDVEACEGTEGWVEFDAPLGGFATEIDCIAAFGITEGLDDGTYGQAQSVTRAQMAVFLSSLALQAQSGSLDIPESYDADAFDDIENSFARDAINLIASLGITEGTEGGESYNPSGIVTRQQMASFVARAHVALDVDFDGIEVDEDAFDDVDADNVHFDNINLLAAAGVVQGTAEGIYSPAAVVTRGQMAAFLARSIGVLEDQGLWNGERIERETPAESNQTFTVTPEDFDLFSATGVGDSVDEREFTVTGLGDTDEVVIDIALAEDVTVSSGSVSFAAADENADPLLADFTAEASLKSVTLDGAAIGQNAGEELDVSEVDEFTFVIETSAGDEVENVVPVIYVGNDGDDLVIDADGAPTADFGIGGETYFVNPALDVEAQATAALIGDTIDIDVQVLDEEAGDELEVAGIGIDVIVADGAEVGPYNDVGAGDVLASDAIVTGDDGVATFTLTDLGAEEDTDYQVFFRWQGEGNLEGLDDVEADVGPLSFVEEIGTADTIAVEFSSAVDATNFTSATYNDGDGFDAGDDVFVTGVGLGVSATVTVTDDKGLPIADEEVDVTANDGADDSLLFSTTLTTDANGQATVAYPAAARPSATATEGRVDEVTFANDDATNDALFAVAWFVENDDTDFTDNVIAADTDAGLAFVVGNATPLADYNLFDAVDDARLGDLNWVNYVDGASQWVDDEGDAVTLTAFNDRLDALLALEEGTETGEIEANSFELTGANLANDEVSNTFTLDANINP